MSNDKKISLNIIETIVLGNTLPKEGDYIELLQKREIENAIQLSEEQLKEGEFKQDEGAITCNPEKTFEFDFSDSQREFIKKQLEKLDADKKLNAQTFSLYEKFCK